MPFDYWFLFGCCLCEAADVTPPAPHQHFFYSPTHYSRVEEIAPHWLILDSRYSLLDRHTLRLFPVMCTSILRFFEHLQLRFKRIDPCLCLHVGIGFTTCEQPSFYNLTWRVLSKQSAGQQGATHEFQISDTLCLLRKLFVQLRNGGAYVSGKLFLSGSIVFHGLASW
jgi:hypothetical protein